MSWITPMALTLVDEARSRPTGLAEILLSGASTRQMGSGAQSVANKAPAPHEAPSRGLGSATAGSRWGWATPRAQMPAIGELVYAEMVEAQPAMTTALAQTMSDAAQMMGRSAEAIWAEAAREWLGRHMGMVAITEADAHNDPPPTAPAAIAPARRRGRSWAEIDALLADLRVPQTAA